MDFGVGLDGFADSTKPHNNKSSSSAAATTTTTKGVTPSASDEQNKTKIPGSGASLNQKRQSGSGQDHDFMRATKVQRSGSGDFSLSRAMSLNHNTLSLLRSDSLIDDCSPHEHMLSFSSSKPESAATFESKDSAFIDRSAQDSSVFTLYQPSSSVYNRTSGYGSGSLNSASMHGSFNGIKGPFTPSQWMELEHQALIYKYIIANVPVPSNLLIPIKKSLYPYGLSFSSTGSFPPASLGWGAFHLAYHGNSNDPEPGRCRRTDGKKWRCSRDAVADQKYCERHINRGRHRSRKPVEGQTGHAAAGATDRKVGSQMTTTSVISSSGAAMNSLAITQQQFKILQPPAAANASTDAFTTRFSLIKESVGQDQRRTSTTPYTIDTKSNESAFTISKPDFLTEESSQTEFGLVSSDSLLNPSQRSSYLDPKSYDSYLNFNNEETQVRQFIDWPQLSMSIPIASSGFSSSTTSPNRDRLALSPLRLSSDISGGSYQNQANWIPISWGTSSGGPLGEVLTTSTGNAGPWNWKGSSSPTGVLQKATFTSLSNSSSGSSPRTEIKKNNNDVGVSHCDDFRVSPIVSSD